MRTDIRHCCRQRLKGRNSLRLNNYRYCRAGRNRNIIVK
jgi:hypothetical protein